MYTVEDTLVFAFLASRMQSLELQNRILHKADVSGMGLAFEASMQKYVKATDDHSFVTMSMTPSPPM